MINTKFIIISILIQILINTNLVHSVDQNDTVATTTETNNGDQSDELNSELSKKLHLVPLTDSINDFGMQLISLLNKQEDSTKNIAFSPLSISQAFSMIISSAQNETLTELMKAFRYDNQFEAADGVNNAYKILLNDYEKSELQKSKRPITLSLPSIVLYANDFNIKKSFRANLKDNYKTDARKTDFANKEALKSVNEFVNLNTNGLIPSMIDSLDANTKMMLANAFYFKGEWANAFEKNFVKDRTFFNADKSTATVNMMFKRDKFDFFQDDDVQVVSLPYQGNASMIILLPQKNKPVDNLIKNLNNSIIDYYRYQMRKSLIELHLPKLKIDNSINLVKPIKELGATKVFTLAASLPGISSTPVFVSDAIHKAFIEINEQGTVAAASTVVSIATKSSGKTPKMLIDRPFVFLIHDQLNNLLLFMGAIKKLN